ncbi:MAG: DUF86 domain-containing protein [Anaerolineales bacterium]|nr:DUF86 domain-containing protein [Anaerolineales bacterium]
MYDVALANEILRQIHWSTETILRRFQPVNSPADFTSSDAGMEKLDAMCMQLIAIGESLKNLDKVTNGLLLSHYPNIEWKRIMGMRDILSHHYFDVDAEIVYNVCIQYVPELSSTIFRMLQNLRM